MSLKGDKYETAEEVKFRLEGSVVLYDGKPVYISRVQVPEAEDRGEIARVFFYPLVFNPGKDKETRKYLSSRSFDLTPFKMGYMNYKGQAIFVARTPIRQNKQGLCGANTTFTNIKGQKADNINFNVMISAQGFLDMVNGVFPSFQDAGEMLGVKDVGSVAISRSFAFVIDHDFEMLLMLHKGIKCGIAMKGSKALQVPPKFRFLREEMEDHHIPIA